MISFKTLCEDLERRRKLVDVPHDHLHAETHNVLASHGFEKIHSDMEYSASHDQHLYRHVMPEIDPDDNHDHDGMLNDFHMADKHQAIHDDLSHLGWEAHPTSHPEPAGQDYELRQYFHYSHPNGSALGMNCHIDDMEGSDIHVHVWHPKP
jgi:hypothetical protein